MLEIQQRIAGLTPEQRRRLVETYLPAWRTPVTELTPGERLLSEAADITMASCLLSFAPETEAEEAPKKRAWWEYLAFLWLGPAAFLKGKEWAEEKGKEWVEKEEEYKKEINKWAAYLLMLLVLIAIVIYLAKK